MKSNEILMVNFRSNKINHRIPSLPESWEKKTGKKRPCEVKKRLASKTALQRGKNLIESV